MPVLLQIDDFDDALVAARLHMAASPSVAPPRFVQVFRRRTKPAGGGWESTVSKTHSHSDAERELKQYLMAGWELHERRGFSGG